MIFSVKYSETCITSKYSSSFKQSFTRNRVPFKLLYQTYLYYISVHFIKWIQSPLNTFWCPKEVFFLLFLPLLNDFFVKMYHTSYNLHGVYLSFCFFFFTWLFRFPHLQFAGSKKQVTFHRSRVQVTAPSIDHQTTQIPLDPIKHFVKA